MRSACCASRRRRSSRAFTLVELLVVIAIIGVLVALLLPAVQAAREAARRMNCQSNISNLAKGVLNYESAKQELPQSITGKPDPAKHMEIGDLYVGNQLSWIVRILPYIEQQAVYQQFNQKLSFTDYINATVTTTPETAQPGVLLCPSDSAVGRSYKSSFTGSREFAKGNYAAYASPEHVTCLEIVPGALIWQGQPLSRVEDGTSNTIMLAEIRTRDEPRDVRGAWALAWVGASVIGADVHGLSTLTRICGQSNPPSYVPNPAYAGYALTPNAPVPPPGKEDAARDDIRQCFDSANADLENMPCNGTNSATAGSNTAAPRSLHPGGVNTVNVDGSVDFVRDEIDVVTFAGRIGINEGVIVNK